MRKNVQPRKERADIILVQSGLAPTRSQAQLLIMAGRVYTGPRRVDKPSALVDDHASLRIAVPAPYVSRGGEKLKEAIVGTGLTLTGWTCLDLGSSTGGFVDCMLQEGARLVYAVDVGSQQLHASLRRHPRVLWRENLNARHLKLEHLEALRVERGLALTVDPIQLVTADLSFISLRTVLGEMDSALSAIPHWLLLWKPQFELGKEAIGRQGKVCKLDAVPEALSQFQEFLRRLGYHLPVSPMPCSVLGKKSKNQEYFIYAQRSTTS